MINFNISRAMSLVINKTILIKINIAVGFFRLFL